MWKYNGLYCVYKDYINCVNSIDENKIYYKNDNWVHNNLHYCIFLYFTCFNYFNNDIYVNSKRYTDIRPLQNINGIRTLVYLKFNVITASENGTSKKLYQCPYKIY